MEHFFHLIQQLKDQKKTVIIASHDLEKEIPFDYYLTIENQKITKTFSYEE